MRQAALEAIAEGMKDLRPEATPEHVKTKLSNLRTQYVDALAKMKGSRVSGCSSDSVAMPTLWCFRELNFLEPHIIHTKGRSNLSKGGQASSAVSASHPTAELKPSPVWKISFVMFGILLRERW